MKILKPQDDHDSQKMWIDLVTKLLDKGLEIEDHIRGTTGLATITAAATSVTFAHGLNRIPKLYAAFPTTTWGNSTKWWVTANATNVTITVDIAPGGNFIFLVFAW